MKGGKMERCWAQWNRMWQKEQAYLGNENLYKNREELSRAKKNSNTEKAALESEIYITSI